MTDEIKSDGRKIIFYVALFLTLGVLYSLIAWIWKSESLSSINTYDGFLLLAAIIISSILAGLYLRYRKTGGQHSLVVFGTVIFGTWLFLIIPLGSLAYLATSPGYYDYCISTEGLDHYRGGLTTDIVIPLPEKNGEPVIPEDQIQYRRFGNWTSLFVMTPQGKMLAFQTGDENLTDINAHFLVPLERPEIFSNNHHNLLQPEINPRAGINTPWKNTGPAGSAYISQVYIDKGIEPARPGNTSIRIDLDMVFHGGMVFGRYGESYRERVFVDIPEGIRGMIPVNVQVITNPDISRIEGYYNEGIAFNGAGYN